MIFDFRCKKCRSIQHNVRVWDKNELTEQEKQRLNCCGEVMESFIDYASGIKPTIQASDHLERTRNYALKRSQEWDKKELPEIKSEQIKKAFFSE